MNKDNENEGIGILTIIVIIILAVVGLYYFFSHRPATATNAADIPLEVPAPIHEETEKGN